MKTTKRRKVNKGGRPRKRPEGLVAVQVMLSPSQVKLLDAIVRRARGAAISRSSLIRACVDAGLASGPALARVRTEVDAVAALVAEWHGGR